MSEYLKVLESAIADVGRWTWWVSNLPEAFQVEFSGVQLWFRPTDPAKPPSSQVALRFRIPRLVLFVTLENEVSDDWPDKLRRDEINGFGVDHDDFTLTASEFCGRITAKALSIQAMVGQANDSPLPAAGEAFLAFEAGPVALIIVAESMGVISHAGELDAQGVLLSNREWWTYWREYWRRRDTDHPMPMDSNCEVTIPAG